MTVLGWLAAVLLIAPLTAAAQDSPSNDQSADDAAGWGPPAQSPNAGATTGAGTAPAAVGGGVREPVTSQAGTERRALHVVLRLRERAGVWLARSDPSSLAQLRSSLEVGATYSEDFTWAGQPASVRAAAAARAEYDAAYLYARSHYDQETLDAYELRFIGLETFVGLRIGGFEIRTGRLLSQLGQGELQSCVDVLNPRDLRQIGLTDVESIRLPAWTTRISIADGTFHLEGYIVHEANFGLLPPLLGRFSPVRKLLLSPPAGEQLAEHSFHIQQVPSQLDPRATQFVGRYGYTGHGLDLDLFAGSVLDQLGVAASPAPKDFEEHTVPLKLFHPRYTLLALSGAQALGDFVLRWELAAQLRRAQSVRHVEYAVPVIDTARYTQFSGLLGFTYFGFTDINFGAELMQSLVLDNPERKRGSQLELLWPVEAPSLSLRYQHLLFDQRIQLHLMALLIGVAPWNGGFVSVGLAYLPRDGMSVRLDYAHYQPSSHFGYFYGFEDNDRLDLSFAWSVALL